MRPRQSASAARLCPTMFANIPTALTWLRIVLIPVFVAVYYLPDAWLSPVAKNWTAMTIFSVAAVTDWLDGYLARRWGVVSAFGAFLDPVADKLMVAAALIMLVWLGPRRILSRDDHHRTRNRDLGAARMDGATRAGQECRGCIHRQGEDRRANDGDHRVAAARAADPRRAHAADRAPSRCGSPRF